MTGEIPSFGSKAGIGFEMGAVIAKPLNNASLAITAMVSYA